MKKNKYLLLFIIFISIYKIHASDIKWMSELNTDFTGLSVKSVQLDYDSARIQFWDNTYNNYQYFVSDTGLSEQDKYFLGVLIFASKNNKTVDIQKTTCQPLYCNFINVRLLP